MTDDDPDRHEDESASLREILAASVLVILLVLLGIWLTDGMKSSARMETCHEAGHRDCDTAR